MTKDQLLEAVNNSNSFAEVIRKLGLNKSRSTYKSLKNSLDKYDIVPNFTKRNWNKHTNATIFCEESTYDRKDLRKKIIKENLIDYKCKLCGITEWCGTPLSLQLDHINGVRNDNRLENLRFLCPNCHSQTDTWGNKRCI